MSIIFLHKEKKKVHDLPFLDEASEEVKLYSVCLFNVRNKHFPNKNYYLLVQLYIVFFFMEVKFAQVYALF